MPAVPNPSEVVYHCPGGTSNQPPQSFSQLDTAAVAEVPGCPAALALSDFAAFDWNVEVNTISEQVVVDDCDTTATNVSVVFNLETNTGAELISVPNSITATDGVPCTLSPATVAATRRATNGQTTGEWCRRNVSK
jgi:hypothetical protein